MRKRRVLVEDANPDEAEIGRTPEKIKTLHEQIRLKDEGLSDFLDGYLTVLQRER